MAFIYKITNLINNKIYIGKTNYSIEHRWQQHLYSSFKNENSQEYNYLLHKALRKYGQENFVIEKIEEVKAEEAQKREQYWIKIYNSCILSPDSNGYNMTFGGEGAIKLDYNEIIKLWDKGFGSVEISKKLSTNNSTIKRILQNYSSYNEKINFTRNIGKKVYQYNQEGVLLKEYLSISAAARAVNVDPSMINKCCNKAKQSCKGYFWSFSPKDTFQKSILSTWKKYKIIQKDTNGDIIEIFPSLAAAGRAMNKKQTKYIKECCEGLRKEMYGYIWEYAEGGV